MECRGIVKGHAWFHRHAADGELFHDLRDLEEPVHLRGSIAHGLIMGQGGLNDIGPHHIDQGNGVGGGFHGGDIEFVELGDVAEDIPELRLKFLLFFRRERESRQVRNVFDIETVGRHAREATKRVSKCKAGI